MNKTEIIKDIKRTRGADIPALQLKYGISYREAKAIIDELVSKRELVYDSGVRYRYVGSITTTEESKADQEKRTENTKDAQQMFSEDSGFSGFRAFMERKRRELFSHFEEDDNDDDDDFDEFDDDEDDDTGDSEESEDEFLHAPSFMSIFKNAAEQIRHSDATAVPDHPAWENEEEFADAVTERLKRLIMSDKKMGKQGALIKADNYLEAVKDTNDKKMIQVYERLLYEITNTSNYSYGQLKKKLFGS